MAQGKQQPKFERNLCIRLRDNCDMDGQTDGRQTNCDFMSSTDIVKQNQENQEKKKKRKREKKRKRPKTSGGIADSHLPLKFGIDLLNGF